jgi:hypothetical protein
MDAGTLDIHKNGVKMADASGLVARHGPVYPYATLDYVGEGCRIRSAPPGVHDGLLELMRAYTVRRAEHQFFLLQQFSDTAPP